MSSAQEHKVTAVVAIIDTATKDQTSGCENSKRCRRSSKLLFTKKSKVLLDSGSDGDVWFQATKHFPYTEKQMAKSYHTSAGIFQIKGRAKFAMKFFECSDSKHYDITPNVLTMIKWKGQHLTLS